MESSDFAGRVAVVTGAWRGLGRAAAVRLHERGASVAVNVRDRERAEALAKEIGERALAVPGDIDLTPAPAPLRPRTVLREVQGEREDPPPPPEGPQDDPPPTPRRGHLRLVK